MEANAKAASTPTGRSVTCSAVCSPNMVTGPPIGMMVKIRNAGMAAITGAAM